MDLLGFQYGHPFLHARIGNEKERMTALEIRNESALLRDQIEAMEGNGMLVTSHLVEIAFKGTTGTIPDLLEYANHFKERINEYVRKNKRDS